MTLNDLVRCGKVRYLGASNVTGWQMQKIVDLNKQLGFNPFISLQVMINPYILMQGRNSRDISLQIMNNRW